MFVEKKIEKKEADEDLEEDEIEKLNKETKSKDNFAERWGWIASLNSLCDDGRNIILRNAWLRASIIEFLNQLAYLKELSERNN